MNTLEKYPIHDISEAPRLAAEEVGDKPKEWVIYKNTEYLFKELLPEEKSKRSWEASGELWAEKATAELANLLNLPHAIYEFAYLGKEKCKNEQCVITPKFITKDQAFMHGNQFIEGFEGVDQNIRDHNKKYTLYAILNVLDDHNVRVPPAVIQLHPTLATAKDLFIGYLCLDAWIGNTDRHAKNWGIIITSDNIKILGPTFDHSSSLGHNLYERKRYERLFGNDKFNNIQAFVRRARTQIFDVNGRKMLTVDLVKECMKLVPEATSYWIDVIGNLSNQHNTVKEIFDRIPDEFIPKYAREFSMAILKANAIRLGNITNE